MLQHKLSECSRCCPIQTHNIVSSAGDDFDDGLCSSVRVTEIERKGREAKGGA